MGKEVKDQWAPKYTANDGNIADEHPTDPVQVRQVPSFMGQSGQPDNQSTDRPVGSV